MKKLSCIQPIILSIALLSIGFLQSTGTTPEKLLIALEQNMQKIAAQSSLDSDVQEINSPAVLAEMANRAQPVFQEILKNAAELDTLVATLPKNQQLEWEQKQLALLAPNKAALAESMTNNIQSTWQEYGQPLAQATLNITLGFVTAAAVPFVMQAAKIGTGNLIGFNHADLLIAGLTGVAGAALTIMTSGKNLFIKSAGSATVSSAIINPSVKEASFIINTPSYVGPIRNYLTAEAIAIGKQVIEDSKLLSRIDYKKALLPSMNQNVGMPSNELVSLALPHVQSAIRNPQIARVLTEAGWIITQSAAVGGLLWLAGLGYGDTSLLTSVGYAALLGVAQGSLSAVASIGGKVSPGGIINVSLAPLAQQALAIAGGTPQAAVAAVIQATATEVSNVLLDESRKNGGLWQTFQQGKALVGSAIANRWGSTWSTISNGWNNIIEQISPSSEQMGSGAGAFGF